MNNLISRFQYRVKSPEDNKVRVLHRNMLLHLGIKFIPEEESDQDSEEEPELEQCQIERQISEKTLSLLFLLT